MVKFIQLSAVLFFSSFLNGQGESLELENNWLDSMISTMSIEQKVGQLFMIRAFSKDDDDHIRNVKDQIIKFQPGGICFFQGTPSRQIDLVKEYQSLTKIPLFIGMDAEWGIGMRFKTEAISFPRNMTIGAINDHQLIYRMGKEIGRQASLIGVNFNFAPVADINNNPENPVINFRSFGEDRINVASKSYAMMKGLNDSGVLASAKHFPGHGDTSVDSHHDLPIIPHRRSRIDSLELFPFKMLINQGIPSIMVAHLHIPSLDSTDQRPTTLSKKVITDLLRNELGFDGLIVTDAMEMKAITKNFDPGEADLLAFLAGNDIILLPEQIEKAYQAILLATEDGSIGMERLNASVRRILREKFRIGLFTSAPIDQIDQLSKELQSVEAKLIKSTIYEKALTLVKELSGMIPLDISESMDYASVSLGSPVISTFQKRVLTYVEGEALSIPKNSHKEDYANALGQLKEKDITIVSLEGMSWYSRNNFGIDSAQVQFIRELSSHTKVALVIFGSPYALKYFEDLDASILVAYEGDSLAQEAAGQAIFGALDISGRLPVTASKSFSLGDGITVPGIKRFGFAHPEQVGLSSDSLARIRDIMEEMIRTKAAPGGQILIAKDSKIVYWESFGHHTYKKNRPVTCTDIYDLASITKIMASTLSVMRLQDEGKFDVKSRISHYIPEEDTTNKGGLIYEDILAHVGKLNPWIPFYAYTMTEGRNKRPDPKYYRETPNDTFSIHVSPQLYLRNDYPDTILRKVFSSELRKSDSYRYSDLAFYILDRTIQKLSGSHLDEYANQNFYSPLGLRKTSFNPLKRHSLESIVPSEKDTYYRMSEVHGTVHDMGAAMMDGVSGHAGLFSNAMDLAILMQMLLNDGYYGGHQFISPETVELYTQRHWRSTRRGIGFDMKELNPSRNLNMSEKASRHTFGHLGFTGTAVFGDPEYNIVYVFLSNRTYPTMENNKLGKNNYRPKVQSVIYNALITD